LKEELDLKLKLKLKLKQKLKLVLAMVDSYQRIVQVTLLNYCAFA
jgi:hypothetical protein